MCGTVAQGSRVCAENRETMGSNSAETVFFYLSTHSKNVEYGCFSKYVAIVATIFSLDRNETLDFRFNMLSFC